jgi:AraC-like DNA-binding protein
VVKAKVKFNYMAHLKKLEGLIEKHFRTVKSPKEYAQMMHVSEKHLNRICKVTLNKTVTEMIVDRILLESKKLMVYSDHNISEIVHELGYEDNSYFSRLFKKKLNQTPVEFMNQHRR